MGVNIITNIKCVAGLKMLLKITVSASFSYDSSFISFVCDFDRSVVFVALATFGGFFM